MRSEVLGLCLALLALASAAHDAAERQDAVAERQDGVDPSQADAAVVADDGPHSRTARWVVFRPMFVSKARQRALNRQSHNKELRRQWRAKGAKGRNQGARTKRALHFPASGAGSGEESSLALRVAVNDLLFQSAPANDLPEPAARHSTTGGGLSGGGNGVGLKPMLLARLRSASLEREPAAEEEAFLLMSTAAGGRPALVPAPTSRPHGLAHRPHKAHKQVHSKPHKPRKGDKQRRRVARDTSASSSSGAAALLGQRLDAMENAMRQRGDLAERVKKYDAQGAFPAYSYTHGRFTRAASVAAAAAAPAPILDKPSVKVRKVKVRGEEDDDDMEVAETVVFRPLFVHRDLHAARLEAKRRRSGLAKKPAMKPLRRRPPPQPVAPAPTAVRRPPTTWYHRRAYLQYPSAGRQFQYQYSPHRRVVYYH